MSRDRADRIVRVKRSAERGEAVILCVRECFPFQSFQLDPNRVVVAVRVPLEGGTSGVPGTVVAADELPGNPIAVDDEVGGHLHAVDGLKVGMGVPVQTVGEERLYVPPSIFSGRQADGVDDKEGDLRSSWARSVVGRGERQSVPVPAAKPRFSWNIPLSCHGSTRERR